MRCVQKNDVVFAMSFDQLVEYGLQHTTNIVNGYPWSFALETPWSLLRVTHENDNRYIIDGTALDRGNVIVVVNGVCAYQLPIEVFEQLFTQVGD